MLYEALQGAVRFASRCDLDKLSSAIWQALGAGSLTDDQAQALAEQVETRRKPLVKPVAKRIGSSPKSAESLARRRKWVAAGFLPPEVAASCTQGEAACLAVIAEQCRKSRACVLTVAHIAALAGVSVSTVHNALRKAKASLWLTVTERRLSRWRNNSNVVRIALQAWNRWLARGLAGGGCKKVQGTNTPLYNKVFAPFDLPVFRAKKGRVSHCGTIE